MRRNIITMTIVTLALASCTTGGDEPESEGSAESATDSSPDAEPESPSAEPTTEEHVSADEETASPDDEPPSPEGPTESFDGDFYLDELWEGSDEQIGLCILWRDGEIERFLTEETDLPWQSEDIDDYFEDRCDATPDGSRARPFPQDTDLVAGDWQLRVSDVNADAWPIVAEENRFNDPPNEGSQFVLVTMEIDYSGTEEPVDPWWTFGFAIVGSGGNTYDDHCGVIPNPLRDVGEMYSGATGTGNVCIPVESDQIEDATIRIGPRFGNEVYVELSSPEG